MAAKRQHVIDYAEDSLSDEEDEMDADEQGPRPGRSRKVSHSTNSSIEMSITEPARTGAPVRRKGRGPSKRPCLNRNALMARENRQKKKMYIEKMENKIQEYQREHQDLKSTIQKQCIEIKRLTNEVAYLKTVLNNNTMITSLLKAMNESLKKMHGSGTNETTSNKDLVKSNADVVHWLASGQNRVSLPSLEPLLKDNLEFSTDDKKKLSCRQVKKSTKIARKTMPIKTCSFPKLEPPPSTLEEDDKNFLMKSSLQSSNYCEYSLDKSPMGLDNQLPTTPVSTMSTSVEQGEASLSDTDFSQLSSFNVDLFDNLDKLAEVAAPLQFEQDTPILFNDDTLFHTFENDIGALKNNAVDPLEISLKTGVLKDKTLFNSLENTGVCLHINSTRVSLEYCSICHLNSLNSEIV